MRSFKDSSGVEHSVTITVGAIRRVLKETGFNLANLTDPVSEGGAQLLLALQVDPDVLSKVLYALKPTATRPDEEEFVDRLNGKALSAGWEVLKAELTDFFRDQGRSEVVEAIQAVGRQIVEAQKDAIQVMQENEAKLARERQEKLAATTGDASTTSPEPSE